MEGLDYFGATDAFADQYITLRVKSIDQQTLKEKLGGSTGSLASGALSLVSMAPKAVLDIATPLIKKQAKGYGVDVDVTVSKVPPSKGGRALSEFWPGLAAGTVLGLTMFGIGKLAGRLIGGK